jgi:hypothetical protein
MNLTTRATLFAASTAATAAMVLTAMVINATVGHPSSTTTTTVGQTVPIATSGTALVGNPADAAHASGGASSEPAARSSDAQPGTASGAASGRAQ